MDSQEILLHLRSVLARCGDNQNAKNKFDLLVKDVRRGAHDVAWARRLKNSGDREVNDLNIVSCGLLLPNSVQQFDDKIGGLTCYEIKAAALPNLPEDETALERLVRLEELDGLFDDVDDEVESVVSKNEQLSSLEKVSLHCGKFVQLTM